MITTSFLGMNSTGLEKLRIRLEGNLFAQDNYYAMEHQKAALDLISFELSRQFRGKSDLIEGRSQWPQGIFLKLFFKQTRRYIFTKEQLTIHKQYED